MFTSFFIFIFSVMNHLSIQGEFVVLFFSHNLSVIANLY